MSGGHPGIYSAADRFDRRGLHDRVSMANRSSLSLKSKEAGAVPLGTRDRESDLGETVIGLPIPGKAVSHHHYLLRMSIPLSYQNCSRRQFGSLLVEAEETRRHRCAGVLCVRSI